MSGSTTGIATSYWVIYVILIIAFIVGVCCVIKYLLNKKEKKNKDK